MNNLRKKVLMMTMAAVTLSAIAQQPVDYVNPIIGTNGMGHTFPGACTPFGWVQLSPDTDTIPHNINGAYQKNAYEYCAGYQYRDKTIVGFSHTHLSGTGHSDLGDILLMPAVGDVKLNPGRADYPEEGYRSRFDHATEKAVPGYYEVILDDYGIKAQLTATQRTGIHKYTFPKGKDGHLILDLVHGIYNYDGKVLWANLRVENDTLLTGYRITNDGRVRIIPILLSLCHSRLKTTDIRIRKKYCTMAFGVVSRWKRTSLKSQVEKLWLTLISIRLTIRNWS